MANIMRVGGGGGSERYVDVTELVTFDIDEEEFLLPEGMTWKNVVSGYLEVSHEDRDDYPNFDIYYNKYYLSADCYITQSSENNSTRVAVYPYGNTFRASFRYEFGDYIIRDIIYDTQA